MKTIIKNVNLYDFVNYRKDQYIIFEDTIIEIGNMKNYKRPDCEADIYDLHGQTMLPGLINCHEHLYSAYILNYAPHSNRRPTTFAEILQQIFWKLDGALDIETSYQSAKCMLPDRVKCGVTTVFDHHAAGKEIRGTLNALRQGFVEEGGLRGIFAFETSDRFPIDQCIDENISFYEECKKRADGKSAGMFGLHATISLSDNTLAQVNEAIGKIPIHIHVGESIQEEHESEYKYGKRSVERLLDSGIVKPNSLFAHCCNINEREAYLMGQNHIHAVLNPLSNVNGANGIPDFRCLERNEVPTIFGTDALSANIADVWVHAGYLFHLKDQNTWWFDYEKMIKCIRESYEFASLHLGVKLGRFEVGYKADIFSIEYIPQIPMSENNLMSHVFANMLTYLHPKNLWCDGKLLMKDYITIYDEEKLYYETRETGAKLWTELEGDY